MVGIENNEMVLVSFDDAINKSKAINQDLIRLAEILSM